MRRHARGEHRRKPDPQRNFTEGIMNTNSHTQPPTLGEIMQKSKSSGAKGIVVALVVIFLLIGIVYTGIHNYNLFSHGLHADQAVFAMIPVILLEGSILLALAGSFVWFSGGAQKMFATGFGWVLFLIVAANTVVDSMMNGAESLPSWLAVYSQFFMFATPVAVMAAWKLILDLDPAKRKLDQQKAIEHALDEAKFQHIQRAMLSEANRSALSDFGVQFGEAMAAHIRNSAPQIGGQIVDAEARTVAPPATAMAKDTPAAHFVEPDPDDGTTYKVGESTFRTRETAERVAKEWGTTVQVIPRPVSDEAPKA